MYLHRIDISIICEHFSICLSCSYLDQHVVNNKISPYIFKRNDSHTKSTLTSIRWFYWWYINEWKRVFFISKETSVFEPRLRKRWHDYLFKNGVSLYVFICFFFQPTRCFIRKTHWVKPGNVFVITYIVLDRNLHLLWTTCNDRRNICINRCKIFLVTFFSLYDIQLYLINYWFFSFFIYIFDRTKETKCYWWIQLVFK